MLLSNLIEVEVEVEEVPQETKRSNEMLENTR